MSAQTTVDETTRFEQLLADLKIPSGDLTGVPQQFAGAVAEAGFEASTGTIAFAGQHSNGDYSVECNNLNGGSGDSIWRTRRARRRPKSDCDIASRRLACGAPPAARRTARERP
jgi:hypothetical protein